MDEITFLWTLAATATAGIQIFISKIIAHEHRDAAFNGVMQYGVSGAVAALVLLAHPWPKAWVIGALLAMAAGGIHAWSSYVRIHSLRFIDSVIYFPLNKLLGPLLVVMFGVLWFGDSFAPLQYLGIGLSLTVPLLLVSGAEHHRQKNLTRGLILMALATTFSSVSVIMVKESLLQTPDVLFTMSAAQIVGAFSSFLILYRERGMRSIVSHIDRRDIWLGLVAGFLAFASVYTLFKALSTGLVSLVYVIQAHYILIPIILSVWWYREHINARKMIAVAVSCFAIALLL
jgi:drug/metabolite transporter (DMT)-like permease